MSRYIDRAELFNRLSDVKTLAAAMAVIQNMPAADVAPRWIPVTERLPKTHKDVLVSKHGKTRLGYRSVSYWMVISGEGSFTTTDVDAWMPLPEPYKEGEQNG